MEGMKFHSCEQEVERLEQEKAQLLDENADLRRQLETVDAVWKHTVELLKSDNADLRRQLAECQADAEWHEPTERPTHSKPVFGYVRYNPDRSLVPCLLTTEALRFDDDRWYWMWGEDETVEADDNLYTVVCWREVPPPP